MEAQESVLHTGRISVEAEAAMEVMAEMGAVLMVVIPMVRYPNRFHWAAVARVCNTLFMEVDLEVER
jgi:hypothetical protein